MSDKMGLSLKQKQVFDFLVKFYKVYGVYPSVREILKGEIDGTKVMPPRVNPSNINQMLKEIEERKWIERLPGKSRAIRVL
tara:strand:- start:2928 stop:3170 length:243 start_codon:yes stop_codon:yes gene_type:complete